MRRIAALLLVCLNMAALATATELSTASSQDLLTVYRKLRTVQAGSNAAHVENAILKRDAATFTFIRGRFTFAAPIAGRVLAAHFQGEGRFELNPPSPLEQRQLGVRSGNTRLSDTFREAVFFFTDDTFAQLEKMAKATEASSGNPGVFSATLKRYEENLNSWTENQRKGYPAMRNLAARMLADLTDSSSQGLFLAEFKGARSGKLLFQISWNRESLLLPEIAKGEEVILLHLNEGNSFEWWAGFHLASEYAQFLHPDHPLRIAHCAATLIELQIAKDNSISATARMEYTVDAPVRILPFNLNGVLRIGSIEDNEGQQISFIQEHQKLDSDPWIILTGPAKPGEKYKIRLAYNEAATGGSRIISQRGTGLYYTTSRESWFPSFGALDDRTYYELRVRSPKKYSFVASGTRLSSASEKEDLITVWKSDFPLGVIGFNYGDFVEATQTAANMEITAYAGKQIPDELKKIDADQIRQELEAERFEAETGISAGERNRKSTTGIIPGGINTAGMAKYAAAISLQAIQLYERLFGALPFKTISVTEQPVRDYGQSWPNLIFLPYDAFLDATTRNSLGLQDSGREREFYDVVGAHEIAHQWWGHLVGWETYHDQWLIEGIAEFASALYLRQFQPKEVHSFWNLRRAWLLSKNSSGYRPVDAGPVWMGAQLFDGGSSSLLYYKGAYIVEMLRTLMYDPKQQNPDNRFLAMMQDFAATFSGKNASTADFRAIVDKHMGKSMDWFFNQWVYGTFAPKYDFRYQISNGSGGQAEIVASITQSGVPRTFQMQLPLYAVIHGEMHYLGLMAVYGNDPIKARILLPARPDKLLLDPNGSILAEINQ